MKLPPFGKEFQPVPRSGVRVAIGKSAWNFQKAHHCPIMVLPENAEPRDFRWPADGKPALVHERGSYNDVRLRAMAEALIYSGSSSVVAIREALLAEYDPRVFFEREVQSVVA
jgi:hypothetical protein